MIIYNVTVNVEAGIHEDWLHWMKTIHLPEVMATGCFKQHRFLKLLQPTPEEGVTYAIQYFAASMADYQHYVDQFVPALQAQTKARYGDKAFAFRTLLEDVL